MTFQEFQPRPKTSQPIWQKVLFIAAVIGILTLIAGCKTTEPVVVTKVVVQPIHVDKRLLTCGSEPVYVGQDVSVKKIIGFTDAMSRWGRGCQRNLKAVGAIIEQSQK